MKQRANRAMRRSVTRGKLELRVKELERAVAQAGEELEEAEDKARQGAERAFRRALTQVEGVVGVICFLWAVREHALHGEIEHAWWCARNGG